MQPPVNFRNLQWRVNEKLGNQVLFAQDAVSNLVQSIAEGVYLSLFNGESSRIGVPTELHQVSGAFSKSSVKMKFWDTSRRPFANPTL